MGKLQMEHQQLAATDRNCCLIISCLHAQWVDEQRSKGGIVTSSKA
jgi:hypothetical protein